MTQNQTCSARSSSRERRSEKDEDTIGTPPGLEAVDLIDPSPACWQVKEVDGYETWVEFECDGNPSVARSLQAFFTCRTSRSRGRGACAFDDQLPTSFTCQQ